MTNDTSVAVSVGGLVFTLAMFAFSFLFWRRAKAEGWHRAPRGIRAARQPHYRPKHRASANSDRLENL